MKHIATMKYIDVMKSVVTMKLSKIVIFAITLFCMFCAVTVHASTRTYGTGEKLYFKSNPSDWSWFGNDLGTGNHVFAYFYNGGSNAWSNEATVYISGILQVTVPTGTWTNVIFTRQSGTTPDWSGVYSGNQSEDIPLNTLTNYIQNFRQKGTSGEGWHWVSTSSAPTADMTMMDGLTCETIYVCQQSIDNGDVYSLAPILNGAKTDYDYEGDHIWLKWVSGHWMPVSNDWSNSDVLLENVADNYYLLWTSIGKSTKRIVHLKRTDCEISCQITSFEYVLTPVNVNDSTFAIEGIVAFTQTAGDLVISYGDSVQRFASPTSPQVFSLQGLRADGTTKTLRAQFEGVGGWTADSTVTAPLPDAGVEIYDSETDDVHYSETGSTYMHNKSIVLRPSVAVTDSFAWTDPNGKVCKSSRTGGDNTFTVADYMQDTTIIMYYTEFNAPPMAESNMMGNGSYETTTSADEDVSTSAYKKTSGYKYTGVWGGVNSKYDVYDNGYSSENGLFGVTTNPHVFWHRMAHIDPRDGTYMAVFDGDNEEQIAWQASTADNENLVLQKGTTYMFSFWVANVNNYGEMIDMGKKNNAILQFKIKYKDKDDVIHEAFLGEATDLNNDEYFDNLWHQNSATFTSDYDADDVTISVVDKNTSGMRIGNDFALDDIRFRAISVQSGTIRARERFEVKFEEPKTNPVNLKVEWVTKPACGEDTCTMRVSFRYPNSTMHDIKLTFRDATIGGYGTLVSDLTLDKTPIPGNSDSTDYVAYFTSGTYSGATFNAAVKADAMSDIYEAKLSVVDAKGINHGGSATVTGDAPGTPTLAVGTPTITPPTCNNGTYSVIIPNIQYTAFTGTKLYCYVDDNVEGKRQISDITYDLSTQNIASVTISDLEADGKTHTVYVNTGNVLDCSWSATVTAPKANVISSFSVAPIQPDCDATTYRLSATWTVIKPTPDGLYDKLIIARKNADNSLTTLETIPLTASNATGSIDLSDENAVATLTHPTIVAYLEERGSSCPSEAADYAHPVVPTLTIGEPDFENLVCNDPHFDLVVPVSYTYQFGKMWAWLDDDTDHKIEITASANCKTGAGYDGYLAESTSSRTTYIVFDNVTLTGEHKVSVECDGEHSCSLSGTKAKSFTAPLLPAADMVTPITRPSVDACDQQTFDLSVSIKFTNQDGDLQVKVDDGSWNTYYTPSESGGEGKYIKNSAERTKSITLTGLPADGGTTHKIYYRFNKVGYCGYDAPLESTALTFPQSPAVISTSVSATPTTLACDATSYTRMVTVNYTNGKGKKIVIEDEEGNNLYTSPTALASSDGSISPSVTLSAIDGAAHYVIAYFEGYDCKSEPAHKGTYTAPVQPVISDVTVSTVGETKCSPYNYSISGTVTYSNADISKKLIVEYGAGALKDEITLSSASATVDFEISDMTATGSELTVKAYFKDAPAACSKTSNTFASPTQPSMDIKNIKQSTPGCDDLTYNLSFDVDYIYQGGNLTVGVEAYGDTTITIPTSKRNKAVTNTVHVTYTGKIPADGEEHTLSASFAGTNSCSDTKTLDDVLSSVIKTVNVTVPTTPIECDAENYVASVSVETQYAVSKSVTIRYTDANDDVVLLGTKVVPAGGTVSFTGLTFNDIEASGTRYVEAFIVGRDTCVKSGDYAVPPTTTIDPFVYGTITDKSTCTGVLYDITGSITYSSKPDGVNPGVRIGGTTVTAEMTDITESGATYTFTDVSVEGDALHLEAYFENKPDCKVPSTTFSSPAQRQLVKIVLDPDPTPACSDDSYTLKGKLQYKNIDDKPQVWRDSESATSIDDGWDANVNEQKEVPFSITMPTDGQKHVIHANVTDWSTTCAIQTDYTAIWRPKVTKVTPSVSAFVHCDEKYDLTLDIDYSRGVIGKMIYASCKEGSTTFDGEAKLTATSGTVQVVIKNLTMRDGTDHALTISFEDVDCEFTGYSYNEPKTKAVTLGAPSIVDVGCGWSTFSIRGTVSANVAGEKIIVTDGYGHSSAELTSSTTGTTYEIGGLTASGTIYAQFKGKDCSKTGTQSFTAPAAKPIPSLTLDEIGNICYGTEKLTVTYTMTGATKYNYTVTRSTTSGLTTVESKTDQTAESIELDTKLWSDGTYTLTMTAVSADGCTKDASRFFTIWAQPKITIEQLVDACDDAENTLLKFNTTDALTYNYYIVGATNLLATPVSVTDGEHTVSLDIKSLNVGNVAKEYTLKMVANSTSCHSDTAEAKFTVNPLPELSFSSIADQCNSVSEVEVTYTPTYVKSFTYSVQKGSAPALVSNTVTVPAAEPYTFKVNTNGWGEGTYSITADLTSPNNCTAAAAAASFTILPKPKVNSLSMQSRCWHSTDKSELSFSVSNATHYQYRIDDGTYSAKAEIGTSKCEVDVSGLAVGKHSVSIIAYSGDCRSEVLTVNEAFEIYPLPTFIFNTAVAHDCYPSTSISVGYTSTDAKTYSYTLTNDETSAVVLSDAGIAASADGIMALNTAGLGAGTYTLAVQPKSENDCEMAAEATMKVIIYPKPTVTVNSIENHCFTDDNEEITVVYTTTDATNYMYKVVGTELAGSDETTGSGSFTINIGGLEADTYTLQLTATSANCTSQTVEKTFDIYPVPAVSVNPLSSIHEGTATFDVPLILTAEATKYDYRFIDKDELTELESNTNVPATQTAITLSTGSLEEGTYMLYVTPKSETCEGVEYPVTVKVANKPTITFSNEELIVCAETETLNIPFAISDDAVSFTYRIMQGTTLVAAEQTIDLATHPSPLAVGVQTLAYGDYSVIGYVTSDIGVPGENETKGFTILAKPEVVSVTQDKSFIGCGETYSAEIQVNIFNAAGRRIYAKYTDGTEEHNPSQLTDALDESVTFTLSGLTDTDHSALHEVKVYVEGFEDCAVTTGYAEPQVMTITSVEVTPLPKSCGEEKFSLTGKVVANCSEGKIVVEYNDTYKTEVNANTTGSDFTIADIPAGGSVTQLKAYFQGKTCGVVESAEFVEPTKPEASIAYIPIVAPACDVTTFDLGFTLSYTYQEAGSLTVWVDDDHKSTYTSTNGDYQPLNTSVQTLSGTITGLPADGRTGQKLYFEFSGAHSCSGSIDLPVFPQTPLITGVSVTNVPLYIEGLEGTYSPTITVTYQKAVGERIVLEYFNKNDQSQLAYSTTAVSGDGSYEFSGLSFDDVTMGSRTVHAYFEDSDCKTGGNHDGTYTAPANSSITFESLTLVNTSTCESLRYNLTGKVSFVGAVVSDLVVEFDATHQYVIPQSQCVAGKALEFAINGVSESIPAEGKTLSAYFSLIPGNVAYSEPVYEPLVPSLDAEIVRVDTIFTCGSKSYTVFLNITSENQRGACFVYDSIAGGTLRRVAKHDGTYNGTDEFTIAMPQRVEEHYIIVRYPNTECVVRFAPISVNPYTKPQPEITLTPIERVCNTATELVLPFAITQGDIAEASLTLTDSKEQTIVSDAELTVNATKDTLTYTLPGQLSAGKHTLMVEVRDTLECVATATLPIELALDGQIYSKWNDVLLVDNSQGLYSAYQWYENGQPLSGKTDQVLYLPDGMKGTYTCLLTTPEGKLFTCEYEFEDIPRSADQQFSDNDITVLPNRVKAGGVVAVQQSQSETLRLILMSATGQRIGEYTQTDSKQLICMPAVQGVYLLRITSDSGMQTEKIVVY